VLYIARRKSTAAVIREWDALAPIRYKQIMSGEDITYRHVLVPNMLQVIGGGSANSVVDAGCGVGVLTHLLGQKYERVTGIDPSASSIEIAKRSFGVSAEFITATLESFSEQHPKFGDLVVANMVLMDVLNLETFMDAAYRLLKRRGRFVFSITHPWFWPQYYGYDKEPWFQYSKDVVVEAPFRISTQKNCALSSTHVHRPLESYIRVFGEAGFIVSSLLEPMPSQKIAKLYPKPWKFPRYLIGLCMKS